MGITIKAVAPGFFGPPPNVAEDFSAIFKWLIEEKGSEELKAFEQYSSRTGDEGELRDKDGSFICDEEVWPHQDWKNSKDGYLRDSKENRIFYKDGTPVPIIKMPELVRKMYEEEIGCSKESNDDDYKE
jgi:hypothetical protein